MAQTAANEQLCVLIDHTTSSTRLVLTYQDVLSPLVFIKSLLPSKQPEKGIRHKVTSADNSQLGSMKGGMKLQATAQEFRTVAVQCLC